jgi:hypothetical protein
MVQTVSVFSRQGTTPEFVVGVDREQVAKARTTALRARLWSAWLRVFGGVLVMAIPLLTLGLVPELAEQWQMLVLMGFPGAVFLLSSAREFSVMRRQRQTWAARGIPEVAMRLSAEGMQFNIELTQTSVFLPWFAVVGVRLKHKLGKPLLVVELAPGVDATTPGVKGFNDPALQRMVLARKPKHRVLWASVRVLRQPLEAIDEAFAHFTGGRLRIR